VSKKQKPRPRYTLASLASSTKSSTRGHHQKFRYRRSIPSPFPVFVPLYGFVNVKATFPVLAPPTQVPDMLPVGHTARAARMHCSQRPLEMLMVAPESTALSANLAVPDWPVVDVGLPPHLVMVPAMPPQIPSSATFWSWKTMFL
jgi:hypothetical protein